MLCVLEPMNRHDEAILAFREGRAADALRLLEELLAASETSELWNDWAAVQLGAGRLEMSENGFTRALQLDSQNADAAVSLGLLLLGRGDRARAVLLLKQALASLPAEQQKIVEALLADQCDDTEPCHAATDSKPQALCVLAISDAFPDPEGSGPDQWLLQTLRGLREQGAAVTFIARQTTHRAQCEPLLHQAGIGTYANDSERLLSLGYTAEGPAWFLHEVVRETRFDLAILTQTFNRSISVPEHYIDDLRRYSPGTRIAIFPSELHWAPRGTAAVKLHDFEKAQDWVMRQGETFDRADVVLVRSENEAVRLAATGSNLRAEVVPHGLNSAHPSMKRILSLTPKAGREESCSIVAVDTLFREALSTRTGEQRLFGQLECYVRFAEQLLREGKPERAREQLRHIFGRLSEVTRGGYFAAQVFIFLKRCYRELADLEMADRCAAQACRCATASTPERSTRKHRRASGPLFSVIVPTYNRLPILRKCLDALEAQTLPITDFEVIVIDDGSSDGTEQWFTQYRPAFNVQYLRQTNSGTGAARRHGVAHATGEYLLLMNDDTICDCHVLEEHLLTQRAHPSERWAVLGNFAYPAAARQRALTQYFCVEPFMFPQVCMEEGCPYGYSHFITCNLSVPRDSVVEAGSFDSTYKLSEDTELGLRLFERGYRVLYHPRAHAQHDHLPYPARNLIRRARVYGADYFYMFRRHPRVMKEWPMPVTLTAMDEENAIRLLGYVEEHRQEIEEAVAAVERWDSIDFEPFLSDQSETAGMVLRLFQRAVPAIHWFYLFETMFQTMVRELGLSRLVGERPVMHAASTGD